MLNPKICSRSLMFLWIWKVRMIALIILIVFGLLTKTEKYKMFRSSSPHFLSGALREFYFHQYLRFGCLQLLRWLRSLGIIHCRNWSIYILKQNSFLRRKWGRFTLLFHEIHTPEFVQLCFTICASWYIQNHLSTPSVSGS